MLIPVVCPTCGMPIGDVSTAFRKMCRERVKKMMADYKQESRELIPSQLTADSTRELNLELLLDELGVIYGCCRTALVTGMNFADYY